jgi:hypothetical protein
MTTSGTSTLVRTRDEIIASALRKVNAFESGETPDDQAVQDASDAFNALIKHWQASGIEIWTTEEAILFPVAGQYRYTIGGSSSDRIGANPSQTTLSSNAAASASSVVLTSVNGVANTYTIGIELDDSTIQWTTVNGAPSGSTVTLATPLTGAASSGNFVIVYVEALVRPIRVIDGRRYNLTSQIEVPLAEMDRGEYMDMPNKTSTGAVNSYFYDRRGGPVDSGLIYFWPAPADTSEAVKLTIARPVEIFTAAGNTPDFPEEWIRAAEWGLADEIADEYDVPEPKRSRIERRAAQYLQEVNWFERELVSIEFVPDSSR